MKPGRVASAPVTASNTAYNQVEQTQITPSSQKEKREEEVKVPWKKVFLGALAGAGFIFGVICNGRRHLAEQAKEYFKCELAYDILDPLEEKNTSGELNLEDRIEKTSTLKDLELALGKSKDCSANDLLSPASRLKNREWLLRSLQEGKKLNKEEIKKVSTNSFLEEIDEFKNTFFKPFSPEIDPLVAFRVIKNPQNINDISVTDIRFLNEDGTQKNLLDELIGNFFVGLGLGEVTRTNPFDQPLTRVEAELDQDIMMETEDLLKSKL